MPTISKGTPRKRDETSINRVRNWNRHNDPRYKALKKAKLSNNPDCELCKKEKADGIVHKVHYPSNVPLPISLELYYDVNSVWATCDQCRRNEQEKQKKESREKRVNQHP
jgi:hypothetical protein